MSKIDLRQNFMKGRLSNKVEIDAAYRDLCTHFGEPVTKMRAFTDSQHGVNENGLLKLCIHFGLKFEVDSLFDTFRVIYNADSTEVAKIEGFKADKGGKLEEKKEIKSDDDLKKNDETEEEELF